MEKVAIIRGSNLNKWEMQNYEPLMDNYDINVYTTNQPNFDISQIKLPIIKLPFKSQGLLLNMQGLEDHLAGKDLIYSADITYLFSAQAVQAKKKFGGKVVCLEWENIPFNYEEHEVISRIKEKVRNGADHFIAVTERAKEALVLEGVPEERIDVISMGIDLNRFKPSEKNNLKYMEQLGIEKEEVVVLFIGRMVWEKGVFDLVHAAAMILNDRLLKELPIRFLMAGRGPELDRLRERAKRLGVSNRITFLENCPYHDIHRLHNLADIFVLPSIPIMNWQEQFGMVLIESMACGKPVITTLSGSIPEVVGDAGILVQPNDHLSLYEAIKELILDKELREQIGKNALIRAERGFDSRKTAEKVKMVFEKVLSKKTVEDDLYKKGYKVNIVQKDCKTFKENPDYEAAVEIDLISAIPGETKKILHIGCSEGALGKKILQRGAEEVVGIETDPQKCEKAKENLSTVICGNIEDMDGSFEEGYFDCIVFTHTLERIKEPYSILQKIKKYIADTGVVIASISNVRYYNNIDMLVEGNWRFNNQDMLDNNHQKGFNSEYIETFFKKAGYEITGISTKIDPLYEDLRDHYAGEVTFGRVTLKGLKPEEVRDLFVSDFLIKAQKAERNMQQVDKTVNLAINARNLEEAKQTIECYLELHPVDMDMLYKHAEICCKLRQYERALESLQKILIFKPQREDVLILREKIVKGNIQKLESC